MEFKEYGSFTKTLDTGTVNHEVNKDVNSQHIAFSVLTILQNILTSALQQFIWK